MVAHYTKGANQRKLATAAILKLEKRTAEEPKWQTHCLKSGKHQPYELNFSRQIMALPTGVEPVFSD